VCSYVSTKMADEYIKCGTVISAVPVGTKCQVRLLKCGCTENTRKCVSQFGVFHLCIRLTHYFSSCVCTDAQICMCVCNILFVSIACYVI
jgi:hypothetical protein